MKTQAKRRRRSRLRSRPVALCLLAAAATLLLTAVFFRSALSRQTPPDPAADALPRLNLIGRHAAEAEEYAKQVKVRYPPTAPEYLEARRRYEEAAAGFESLVETLSVSVSGKGGADVRNNAAVREKVRVAVAAGDAFADWTESELRLMRRARAAGGASPKADDVTEAAAAVARDFGPRNQHAKARAAELMRQLVKFKPWDEVPPVAPPPAVASPASSPSPLPSPSPAGP